MELDIFAAILSFSPPRGLIPVSYAQWRRSHWARVGTGPSTLRQWGGGHRGAQKALNVANVGNGNKAVNDVFQRNIVFRRTDRTILPK